MGMFDFINKEAEENEKNFIAPVVEYQVEAYQIIRLRKQTVGNKVVREVLDTIYPVHGNSELAKGKAVRRAEVIGNCFVVEKCERIVPMSKSEPEEEAQQYEN
jgi:hypothetical protein